MKLGKKEWERIGSYGLVPTSDSIKEAKRNSDPRGTSNDSKGPNPKEVEICREWIRLFASPTKTLRVARSSYGLKHQVEDWTQKKSSTYIANGAFIEAARLEGYRMERAAFGSPNAVFNMKIDRSGKS
jgi:hypothetical protein